MRAWRCVVSVRQLLAAGIVRLPEENASMPAGNSAKISTALRFTAETSVMSGFVRFCRNAGATSCVVAPKSTTYCVAVLTGLVPGRKVSRSETAARTAVQGSQDRCNHLSKHLLAEEPAHRKLARPEPFRRPNRLAALCSGFEGVSRA